MVEETQKTTTLQPTGTVTDANSIAQGLQPQSQTTPQQTSDQTISGINMLDRGGVGISLSNIPTTSSVAVKAVPAAAKPPLLLYGTVAIICLAIFAWMIRGLLHPQA